MIDRTKSLSLYVHIPYCTKKCSYCAFYSLSRSKWPISPDLYSDTIISEIEKLTSDGLSFDTIYIGGGNPGLLTDEKLIEIIRSANKNKRANEITVEMNPEELTEKRLSRLEKYLDRISIGIQSLNERALKTLGRNSDKETNIKALSLLKESSLNYNADLITAIPNLSVDDTIKDIEDLERFKPNHISFYCLTYEEGTPLYKNVEKRDEEYEYKCLKEGWRRLKELGYEHYEISNFAKEGHYSKHNINYWRLNQYIGLGPSAESSVGWKSLYSNRFDDDIRSYIEDSSFKYEKLDSAQSATEYIMVALRTKWGIDKEMMRKRFEIDFDSTFKNAIDKLASDLYIKKPSSFSLTEDGFMILDSIVLSLALECL